MIMSVLFTIHPNSLTSKWKSKFILLLVVMQYAKVVSEWSKKRDWMYVKNHNTHTRFGSERNWSKNNSKRNQIDMTLTKTWDITMNFFFFFFFFTFVCCVCVLLLFASCPLRFYIHVHVKNNAMPSILIKIKENLFTETNDLLASRSGSK